MKNLDNLLEIAKKIDPDEFDQDIYNKGLSDRCGCLLHHWVANLGQEMFFGVALKEVSETYDLGIDDAGMLFGSSNEIKDAYGFSADTLEDAIGRIKHLMA